MSLGYDYVLNRASCEALNDLPRGSRDRLLDFFQRLASNAFTVGDYQERGEHGLALEVALVENKFLVTWHPDHAVKEVCVLRIEIV
ncbi:MAG: hypothetical protein NTV51_20355 [Verrucomicrobia bacterium]|nr:hypothetical protein [Verrucomicrobiota bacterium]